MGETVDTSAEAVEPMTCHEFTRQTRQELRWLGFDDEQAEAMVSDASRMDELHAEMLSPEDAALELIVDAHIMALPGHD